MVRMLLPDLNDTAFFYYRVSFVSVIATNLFVENLLFSITSLIVHIIRKGLKLTPNSEKSLAWSMKNLHIYSHIIQKNYIFIYIQYHLYLLSVYTIFCFRGAIFIFDHFSSHNINTNLVLTESSNVESIFVSIQKLEHFFPFVVCMLVLFTSDSHLPKKSFIWINENHLKMMKNAFYLFQKLLSISRQLYFCFDFLVMQKKRLDQKEKIDFKIYDVKTLLTNNYIKHIAQYLTK